MSRDKRRVDLTFGGLKTSAHESRIPLGNCVSCGNVNSDLGILQGRLGYTLLANRTSASTADVGWGLGYGIYTGDEVQRIAITNGTVTGGTYTLTFGGQTTANINWNATATDIQGAVEALSTVNIGDIKVKGGALYTLPVRFYFGGQYAGTDVSALTIDVTSLTGSGTIAATVTEEIKGGTFEQYVGVLQRTTKTAADLFKVTSSDGFLTQANCTYTQVSSETLNSSDWFFEQYGRYIYMINPTGGLVRITLGGGTTIGTQPKAPALQPPHSVRATSNVVGLTATSQTNSGFASAPTVTTVGNDIKVVLAAAETNADVTINIPLAAGTSDFTYRDFGVVRISRDEGIETPPDSILVSYINADGSPLTIDAGYYGSEVNYEFNTSRLSQRAFHFADIQRSDRDNVAKLKVQFKLTGTSGRSFKISLYAGDNWQNDTKELTIDKGATQRAIEYAYSYYSVSGDSESDLSPVNQTADAVPFSRSFGGYVRLTLRGTKDLTTSDKIYPYRREHATGKWRRLPNADGTFGKANVTGTGATVTFDDHFMEHELIALPEPASPTGWPPSGSSGIQGEQIGFWKQSLAVAGNRQLFLSYQGRPQSFLPSPDDELVLSDTILNDPTRGVSEYVSDNRSEQVNTVSGQDTLYVSTANGVFAKVGDRPSDSTIFRKLPGSRGSLGKRAGFRYSNGVIVGSQDGLWYYAVGRGFSGEDNGALVEREVTEDVRTSYLELIQDELVRFEPSAALASGRWRITFNGHQTGWISYAATGSGPETGDGTTGTPYVTMKAALEALADFDPGDLEFYGGPINSASIRVETKGQYQGVNVGAFTIDNGTLAGGTISATVEHTGGTPSSATTGLIVVEHGNELYVILGARYLMQSRSRNWYSGCFKDRIMAVHSSRTRGLMGLTSDGKLMKLNSASTDNGTAQRWFYETGSLVGPRSRITQIEGYAVGTPTISITQDDGLGGTNTTSSTLAAGQYFTFNVNSLPGVRHKIRIEGASASDKVLGIAMAVEDMGDATGS